MSQSTNALSCVPIDQMAVLYQPIPLTGHPLEGRIIGSCQVNPNEVGTMYQSRLITQGRYGGGGVGVRSMDAGYYGGSGGASELVSFDVKMMGNGRKAVVLRDLKLLPALHRFRIHAEMYEDLYPGTWMSADPVTKLGNADTTVAYERIQQLAEENLNLANTLETTQGELFRLKSQQDQMAARMIALKEEAKAARSELNKVRNPVIPGKNNGRKVRF